MILIPLGFRVSRIWTIERGRRRRLYEVRSGRPRGGINVGEVGGHVGFKLVFGDAVGDGPCPGGTSTENHVSRVESQTINIYSSTQVKGSVRCKGSVQP